MSVDEAGEDKFLESDLVLGLEREVARGIRDKYEEKRKDGEPYCMFARVNLEDETVSCTGCGTKFDRVIFDST